MKLLATSNESKARQLKPSRRRIGELSRDTQKLKDSLSMMALIALELKIFGIS